MEKIEIKAHAKINLSLEIKEKLPNGYHEINSLFQAINLYDVISISKADKFELTGTIVSGVNENLVTRAVKSLEETVGLKIFCKIHLIKGIPVSAGLGGGSSDAAAVLVGLNEFYSFGISNPLLESIGLKIGSDVLFFVTNHGRAIVRGIGEKITPINLEEKLDKCYVLARPHKRISTKEIFELYDKENKPFIEIVGKICPDVLFLRNYFSELSKNCKMSGSGPTVFAEFENYKKAKESLENRKMREFDGDLFICKPVSNTYEIL